MLSLVCKSATEASRNCGSESFSLRGLGLQLETGFAVAGRRPARPEIEFILLVFVSLYRLHFIIFINPDQRERRKEVQRREERKEVGEKRNTALG